MGKASGQNAPATRGTNFLATDLLLGLDATKRIKTHEDSILIITGSKLYLFERNNVCHFVCFLWNIVYWSTVQLLKLFYIHSFFESMLCKEA